MKKWWFRLMFLGMLLVAGGVLAQQISGKLVTQKCFNTFTQGSAQFPTGNNFFCTDNSGNVGFRQGQIGPYDGPSPTPSAACTPRFRTTIATSLSDGHDTTYTCCKVGGSVIWKVGTCPQ